MDLEHLTAKIKEKFPKALLDARTFRGEHTLDIRSEEILPVCQFLRGDPELSFDFLTDLCGTDDYPRDPRFGVVYHLCALKTKSRLRLKVSLPSENPHILSVVSVWKGANWLEREAFDMYGITFDGHPDLRRILLAPDWQGHPLRKDFPLKG